MALSWEVQKARQSQAEAARTSDWIHPELRVPSTGRGWTLLSADLVYLFIIKTNDNCSQSIFQVSGSGSAVFTQILFRGLK